MPRRARIDRGGLCYHVLNRGNERRTIFHNDAEYHSFLQLIEHARKRVDMRVLAFCLMPNHFHLCLWPMGDGDLGTFMQWLMTKHVAQYRASHAGNGHVWQGRFKSFPTQDDSHLLSVLQYIERNPVRAGLVTAAHDWVWSSAGFESRFAGQQDIVLLSSWPMPKPVDWTERLRSDGADLQRLRKSISSGTPFGEPGWAKEQASL